MRCAVCNYNKLHECPVKKTENMTRIQSLDNWPPQSIVHETRKSYITLFLKAKEELDDRCHTNEIPSKYDKWKFVILPEDKAVWVSNGVELTPPAVSTYFEVDPIQFLSGNIDAAELEVFRRRIQYSSVFGKSNRKEETFPQRLSTIIMATYLDRHLCENSENYLSRQKFVLRLSKGAVDGFDTDTSSIVFLASTEVLKQYIQSFSENRVAQLEHELTHLDQATSLLILPFEVVQTCTEDQICEYLKEQVAHEEPETFKLKFHLKNSVIEPFQCESRWKGLSDLNLGVLVSFTRYNDSSVFDICGGKVELGELPYECASREAFEEFRMDVRLNSGNVSFRGDDSATSASNSSNCDRMPDWEVFYHNQTIINSYYLFHSTCKSDVYAKLLSPVESTGKYVPPHRKSQTSSFGR